MADNRINVKVVRGRPDPGDRRERFVSGFGSQKEIERREVRLLDACFGRPVDTTPVWLMRQAGRYLPEYRALRETSSFLEMCKTPDLIVEATLQPIRRFALDAAIIFSDILIPVEAMGVPVEFVPEPRLPAPVRTRDQASALRRPDPFADTGFLLEAIAKTRAALPADCALIGFAGAPFTLATYLVEGGGSRDFRTAKTWMFQDPQGFSDLLRRISDAVAPILSAQMDAGANAVQLFDTWAGTLSPDDWRRFALPAARSVIERVRRDGKPVIYFVNGAAGLLDDLADCGADVIGLDFRVRLDEAAARIGTRASLQGNLDPIALFAPPEELERRVADILRAARRARGHVFNLGHGVHRETPIEAVQTLVEAVHRAGARGDRSRGPGAETRVR